MRRGEGGTRRGLWKFGTFRNTGVFSRGVWAVWEEEEGEGEEKDDDRFAVVRGTRLSSASCAGPTRCILSRDNAAWTIGARGWDGR